MAMEVYQGRYGNLGGDFIREIWDFKKEEAMVLRKACKKIKRVILVERVDEDRGIR